MTRRISAAAAAVLVCALLLLTALAPRAHAVTFTAINNELLELTADTQPEFYDGKLYVPGSVFANTSLGVVMASARQQIFLYKDGNSLTFSVADGTTKDQTGNYYSNIKPIYRNGRIYVPVDFVCVYFGFSYSYISAPVAPIVRIKSGSVLDDSVFADAATPSMRNRLSRYESALATPTPSVEPTPVPTADIPYYGDVSVYIALRGADAEYTPALLERLARAEVRACFFLTAEEMDASPDLVRRMMVEGHSVGLLSRGDDASCWQAASEALLRHTVSRSLLAACCEGGGEAAGDMGLRLCFDGSSPICSENGEYGYNDVMADMLNADEAVSVLIETDPAAVNMLDRLLDFIRLARFDVRVLRETSELG